MLNAVLGLDHEHTREVLAVRRTLLQAVERRVAACDGRDAELEEEVVLAKDVAFGQADLLNPTTLTVVHAGRGDDRTVERALVRPRAAAGGERGCANHRCNSQCHDLRCTHETHTPSCGLM